MTEVEVEQVGAPETPVRRTLSVCCMTACPAPRVAEQLRLFRTVADEIVVALDDRAGAEAEAVLAPVADELVRFRYRDPVDRPLRWLFSLCGSEWILNIDDDEVPSAALLHALPELVRADDVTHCWLWRRWLWPTADRIVADHPWSSDYQLRLVLNDPRVLRFPAETHRPLEALGPHRYLRLPLYHADLLVNPFERRLAKARHYEALRPGKRIGGGPMNHVYHLPERRRDLATEPLPDADLARIRALFGSARPPQPADERPRRAPVADDETIEALWAGREVDRRARLEWLDEPRRMRASEQRAYAVSVMNLGRTTWPWGAHGEPEVKLGYRWLDPGGALVTHGLRTALPVDVAPGGAEVAPLHVLAPDLPGRYRLQVDLIEHVDWFGCAIECEVAVDRRLRVALVGDLRHLLPRLADEAPEYEPLVLRPAWETPPRFAPPHAPDLRAYLLEGIRRRPEDLAPLAARTAALLRAARKLRGGEPGRPLERGGQRFLQELALCSHLLFVAGSADEGTLELWLQAATAAAARELGLEIVVQRGAVARARGRLDRALVRIVYRRATIVEPTELAFE